MAMSERLRSWSQRGQMTLELAVAFPVLITVAVVAVNAMQFIAECAAFDRSAHDAIRVYAASPAAGQGSEQGCAQVHDRLQSTFGVKSHLEVDVVHGAAQGDLDEYTATLKYYPNLFGMGLRSEVFGVPLPHLTHTTRFVVDTYKPGVLI